MYSQLKADKNSQTVYVHPFEHDSCKSLVSDLGSAVERRLEKSVTLYV